MATAVKQRRGTADEHDTDKGDGSGFTGLEGEITVDTTNDTIRVHDGSQVGGHRLAKYSELSTVASPISPTDAGTDTTMFPLLSGDASGTLSAKTDASSLTYNASSGTLSATAFSGDLTGDVTGNVSGSSGSCTGNSATATTAGQATLATTANAVATSTSGTGDQFVTFVDNDTAGSQTHRVHGEVKYNTSNTTFTVNGTVAATTLTGAYDADQLTGTIDDARIPSGIARDSELSSFITASSSDVLTNKSIDAGQLTGTISDSVIPSGIARDSELSSFITASSTDILTNKTIDASQLDGTIANARLPSAATNITSVGTLSALTVDNIAVDGSTIGHTSDPDLLTLASASLTVAGATTINGTLNVNASSMEISNIGNTSDNLPILSLFNDDDQTSGTNKTVGGVRFYGRDAYNAPYAKAQKVFVAGMKAEMPTTSGVSPGQHTGKIIFHFADASGGGRGEAITADPTGDLDPACEFGHNHVTFNQSTFNTPNATLSPSALKVGSTIEINGGNTSGLQIRDAASTFGNSLTLHSRLNKDHAFAGVDSNSSQKVMLPCVQNENNTKGSTLNAGFLYGGIVHTSKTTMSRTQFCSMRGMGLYLHSNASNITVDLPKADFVNATDKAMVGDMFKFVCGGTGEIHFDTDASGDAQTIYLIGDTTDGSADLQIKENGANFHIDAGGYMTFQAISTDIWMITEHCGVDFS